MRIVVLTVIVCACRRSDVVPDVEPLVAPSSELPGWFGRADLPARRISGRLLDGELHPLVGVAVHLRIDAPDPTAWRGREATTDGEGRFDFGEVRAGPYSVWAMANERTSRVVEVDAREANRELDVFAFPCKPEKLTIETRGGTAIEGVRIDIGGVIIGTTDSAGTFTMCTNSESIVAHAHARGFAARNIPPRSHMRTDRQRVIGMEPAITLRGRVLGAGGPQAGVAVRPIFVDQYKLSHGSPYTEDELPVQFVTGADGRFAIREVPERDVIDEISVFQFRVLDHEEQHYSWARIGAHSREEVVLDTSPKDDPRDKMLADMRVDVVTLSGVVTHNGVPVPDADVYLTEINIGRRDSTRTRGDGRFDLRIRVRGSDPVNEIYADLHADHASGLHGSRTLNDATVTDGRVDAQVAIEMTTRFE